MELNIFFGIWRADLPCVVDEHPTLAPQKVSEGVSRVRLEAVIDGAPKRGDKEKDGSHSVGHRKNA